MDDTIVAQLQAYGAPPEVIAAAQAQAAAVSAPADEHFEYFEDNAESVGVFIDLVTSWEWLTPAMGKAVRMGLRASEIESAIRAIGVKKSRRAQIYRDVRLMERAALEVLHEEG